MYHKLGSIWTVIACGISLSGCTIFVPHLYYESPMILGEIMKNQTPMEGLDVHLLVGDERKQSVKTDEQGKFKIEPIKKMEYFITLGADLFQRRSSLIITIEGREYLGLLTMGSEEEQVNCDITRATNSDPNGFCQREKFQ